MPFSSFKTIRSTHSHLHFNSRCSSDCQTWTPFHVLSYNTTVNSIISYEAPTRQLASPNPQSKRRNNSGANMKVWWFPKLQCDAFSSQILCTQYDRCETQHWGCLHTRICDNYNMLKKTQKSIFYSITLNVLSKCLIIGRDRISRFFFFFLVL